MQLNCTFVFACAKSRFAFLSSPKVLMSCLQILVIEFLSMNCAISCLVPVSSIPARMKKIQLKMKALECSQDFSHYKSMGIFPDAQGQLTP